jgi:hypothetical protein
MSTIHATNSYTFTENLPLVDKTNKSGGLDLAFQAEVIRVRFSSQEITDSILFQFGEAKKTAVQVLARFYTQTLDPTLNTNGDLTVILIGHQGGIEATELARQLQDWVDASTPEEGVELAQVRSILIPLQGAQIIWQPKRAVVVADPQRLQAICRSLIEATFYERELKRIESEIDNGWEQTQTDSKFAVEFLERNLTQRKMLEERFQTVLGLRVDLVRLTPQILVPHVFPPTIASQIGERLRERTRMAERLELVEEKLSAQERVYDHCVQRAGDYLIARKGLILEWVIIILLFLQTLLWIIDFLSASGTST